MNYLILLLVRPLLCIKHLGQDGLNLHIRNVSDELISAELAVAKEVPIPVVYKEVKLDHGCRLDLLVENKVVTEIKTVDVLPDVHEAQILTYLRLGNFKLGLLINYNVSVLIEGIRRYVNNL